jgi:adenosylcobinamide kinase / adenosylcobinamide-phosphate guanylyltransferase
MTGSPLPSNKLPPLTLVLGGARSGKSRLAERLVTSTGLARHYIATADAWDDEMADRIAWHQADRGPEWQTWGSPRDVDQTLARIPANAVILLDCATLWLTNHLLADADIDAKTAGLLTALAACAAPVVVVSNEVGLSIVPENALARAFRDHQGRLNQRLAAQADLVVGVIAGLPFALKGTLPPL